MKTRSIFLASAILVLVLSNLACGLGSTGPVTTIEQWAASGSASSEWGSSSWTAQQATGAPDTTDCGDDTSAWASAGTNTIEWINLAYTTPVHATKVVIYENYNPSYITLVELQDTNGSYHTIYTASPKTMACPNQLTISINKTSYLVKAVRITVDQTTLNSWNEIDAVQLIGTDK
jgi:Tfp pilus assembly major pilin PilA